MFFERLEGSLLTRLEIVRVQAQRHYACPKNVQADHFSPVLPSLPAAAEEEVPDEYLLVSEAAPQAPLESLVADVGAHGWALRHTRDTIAEQSRVACCPRND